MSATLPKDSLGTPEARLVAAMRAADKMFEKVGGTTRHYVRDCLIPEMTERGIRVVDDAEQPQDELRARVSALLDAEDLTAFETCVAIAKLLDGEATQQAKDSSPDGAELSRQFGRVLREHNLADRDSGCADLTYVVDDLMKQVRLVHPTTNAEVDKVRNAAYYRGRDEERKRQRGKWDKQIESLTEIRAYWKARALAAEGQLKASCGKPGAPITAFVHRVDDDSSFGVRDATHQCEPVKELVCVDTEGRFIRLRMSAEALSRCFEALPTPEAPRSPAVSSAREQAAIQRSDLVEFIRIIAPEIARASDEMRVEFSDEEEFEKWLDSEKRWPWTYCHDCNGDIGTPRKWITHVCKEGDK